ncbi:IPT/TIG domain-containing protein [Methylobacter sp. S3L5C]|uniref:IPT/TIG domain-containing protein n=1 Tax=Methylobacter sp. S3L5C TaxID=2839024 RepID=UPI001FAC775B|nr:IPT/TIG domain-containing protein [Methylobacter sp. S3L5C]UOA07503.1 IPT/TIG domain-containing protein [Methylobacter sp. S3L5C]
MTSLKMRSLSLLVFFLLPSLCLGVNCDAFFSDIPGQHTCEVKSNQTLTYVVKAGNGGTWDYDNLKQQCVDRDRPKGLGARIKGTLQVKGDHILYITVGSSGANGCETGSGGGGGGYSSISRSSFNQNPMVVAGGGGGNSFGSRGIGGNGGITPGITTGGSGGNYPDGFGLSGGLTINKYGQINADINSGGLGGVGLTDAYSGGVGGNVKSIGQHPQQPDNTGAAGGGGGFGGFGAEGGYYYYQGNNSESKIGPGGPIDFSSGKYFGAGGQGGSGAGGGGGGYAGGGGGGSNVTDPHRQRSGTDSAGGGGGGSSLMLPGGMAVNSSSAPVVTFLPAPVVNSINPATGPASGGTKINLKGTGFMPDAKVWIGGVLCESLVFISPINLTCITGQNSVNGFDVVVTNPDTQIGLGVGFWGVKIF